MTHQTGPATSTTKIIWNGIPDLISVVPYPYLCLRKAVFCVCWRMYSAFSITTDRNERHEGRDEGREEGKDEGRDTFAVYINTITGLMGET
ncbi:hypothetical protein N7489_005383 [Penicillium chrysogenum]|uniref:uncharacterized protein n=1 Tax=Penicillium chrysogenum TaxID=5076 RepID=UPI0024DF0D5A|nr:uncharacterized protein N7489_005383 [Penicillium chrysogenum]KAJ5245287.1 hypothetical protein N7489_005383 [Penicillium chrysogenum]